MARAAPQVGQDESDADDFARQFGRHEKQLRQYVARLLRNPEDAKDVVQEIFISIFQRVASGPQPVLDWKGYLFRSAQRMAFKQRRRSQQPALNFDGRESLETQSSSVRVLPMTRNSDAGESDKAISDELSPERIAIAESQMQRVAAIVDALPGKQREVFIKRRIEGLPVIVIADQLGIAKSTVEKHFTQAMLNLLEQLENSGDL